jgi:hypothetical protein
MYVFPAVFFKTATGYNVLFPDLPGCFSVGATLDEAHRMGKEALGTGTIAFRRRPGFLFFPILQSKIITSASFDYTVWTVYNIARKVMRR